MGTTSPMGRLVGFEGPFPSGYTVVFSPSSGRFGQVVFHFLLLLPKETSDLCSGCRWPSGTSLPQNDEVQRFTGLSDSWHSITAGGGEGVPASHQGGKRK